ncbi:LytR/AlgR family response regulator transcription factor [Pedobacter sp. R-06]|uniref:LytR/AlgR family response regulator transcription factor n=1 Tax=Pedobacter sp. R-06 TaxID=3404051 RepID=UPI003CFA8333
MNCLIVDDSKKTAADLKYMISMDSSLILLGEYNDASLACEEILRQPVDIVFLDIEMPGMYWIGLSKNLDQNKPKIIFTTNAAAYKIESCEMDIADLLTTPISPNSFRNVIEKAKEFLENKKKVINALEDDFIFIRDANVIKRLKVDEILYLEAMGDQVKIHVINRVYAVNSSLKSVEQKLSKQVFLRTHRSFIINISKIDTMEGGMLVINRNKIPVSDAYRALVNKRMHIL